MENTKPYLRKKGKRVKTNCIKVKNQKILITGKLFKIGRIKSETWLEPEIVKKAASIIDEIKSGSYKIDIFTFSQKIPEISPKYKFYLEWDNVAAIQLKSYDYWIHKQANRKARQAVTRAKRRGIVVKLVDYDDNLVKGISAIYNETPIRQGREFPHYGKDFESVKKENASFLERSDFIAAFHNEEIVGIIKIVYQGEIANILQIISSIKHRDKFTMNALIAEAVQLCVNKKKTHLLYGKWIYNRKQKSSLTDFKRHNGFAKIEIPRYYIPMNLKGKIILKLGLHHGLINKLPQIIYLNYLDLRKWLYSLRIKE